VLKAAELGERLMGVCWWFCAVRSKCNQGCGSGNGVLMVHQGTLRGVLLGGCWVGTVDTALMGTVDSTRSVWSH